MSKPRPQDYTFYVAKALRKRVELLIYRVEFLPGGHIGVYQTKGALRRAVAALKRRDSKLKRTAVSEVKP